MRLHDPLLFRFSYCKGTKNVEQNEKGLALTFIELQKLFI